MKKLITAVVVVLALTVSCSEEVPPAAPSATAERSNKCIEYERLEVDGYQFIGFLRPGSSGGSLFVIPHPDCPKRKERTK